MQIARVASGFFLVIQIIVLLEFTFVVNEWLVERADYGIVRATLVLGAWDAPSAWLPLACNTCRAWQTAAAQAAPATLTAACPPPASLPGRGCHTLLCRRVCHLRNRSLTGLPGCRSGPVLLRRPGLHRPDLPLLRAARRLPQEHLLHHLDAGHGHHLHHSVGAPLAPLGTRRSSVSPHGHTWASLSAALAQEHLLRCGDLMQLACLPDPVHAWQRGLLPSCQA